MFETQKVRRHDMFRKEWSQHWNICKSQMGQDQVSGGVSVFCWLAAPIAMFYGKLRNLVIRSKSLIKSSSVECSQIGVMSDQLRVSLYMVMSQIKSIYYPSPCGTEKTYVHHIYKYHM